MQTKASLVALGLKPLRGEVAAWRQRCKTDGGAVQFVEMVCHKATELLFKKDCKRAEAQRLEELLAECDVVQAEYEGHVALPC